MYIRKLHFLLIIFLFALNLPAQNNNRNDIPISEEHFQILEKRRGLIGEEISAEKNEWIGIYQQGDHHPTYFMWSLTQGFLTWGSNHTFYPSRLNFGKAEFSNNRLIIAPEIAKDHLNYQQIATEFVPIKWGEQHFLIPADELKSFAYAVHSGAPSEIVGYFMKSDDYEKTRAGLPNLPAEYQKIMTMKAVRPKITAVKKDAEKFWNTELTLNLGRNANLGEGMILYYSKPAGGFSVVITEIQEKSAKAKFNGGWGEDNDPKVGLRLTSKAPEDLPY